MAASQKPPELDPRVPRARNLRRGMTDAERKLWWHLRRIPIEHTHFRRQATIGRYFADFACHEQRLIIEVDGGQHNQADCILADTKRTEYFESQGYRVLRFWNNDVLMNIEGTMESIYAALVEAGPPPLTPPHRAKTRGGRGTAKLSPAAESLEANDAASVVRLRKHRP